MRLNEIDLMVPCLRRALSCSAYSEVGCVIIGIDFLNFFYFFLLLCLSGTQALWSLPKTCLKKLRGKVKALFLKPEMSSVAPQAPATSVSLY